jgi:hypothetical protein
MCWSTKIQANALATLECRWQLSNVGFKLGGYGVTEGGSVSNPLILFILDEGHLTRNGKATCPRNGAWREGIDVIGGPP